MPLPHVTLLQYAASLISPVPRLIPTCSEKWKSNHILSPYLAFPSAQDSQSYSPTSCSWEFGDLYLQDSKGTQVSFGSKLGMRHILRSEVVAPCGGRKNSPI